MRPRVLVLQSREQIISEFRSIGVDSRGIEIMLEKAQLLLIKISDIKIPAANILKQIMLSNGGDAAVCRGAVDFSVETTDVLLMGTRKQYGRLIDALKPQPFGLRVLGEDIASTVEDFLREGYVFRCGRFSLSLGERTHIMGILNVTPDSFSDGGKFARVDSAIEHALQLVRDGADIIDVGGESTRPGSCPVSIQEEIDRVVPVIQGLAGSIEVPISIDTYKAEVAREAIYHGASIVNDISGLSFDDEMADVVAESNAGAIIMHMKGSPKSMQQDPQYESVTGEIMEFLQEQIERALQSGISKDRLVVDPGIGFGKRLRHNLEILRRLQEFKVLGCPILVGTSRKSMIGELLNVPVAERLEGTAATCAVAVMNGAHICRVHDVLAMSRVVRIVDAVMGKGGYGCEL